MKIENIRQKKRYQKELDLNLIKKVTSTIIA